MKKAVILALSLTLSSPVFAEEKKKCDTDEIPPSPHIFIEAVTIPFKMIAAVTFGPRCLLEQIPKIERTNKGN